MIFWKRTHCFNDRDLRTHARSGRDRAHWFEALLEVDGKKKPRGPERRNAGPVCDVIVSRNVSAPAQRPGPQRAVELWERWEVLRDRRCSDILSPYRAAASAAGGRAEPQADMCGRVRLRVRGCVTSAAQHQAKTAYKKGSVYKYTSMKDSV